MRTSDLDAMEFKRDEYGRSVVKSGGKWMSYGRVVSWCRFMGRFRRYGEWTVQETCSSAACRGTVRARISGPRGTVEAWNGNEVFFVPKGVKFSKLPAPDCHDVDRSNGIVYWPELPFDADAYEGRSKYGQHAAAMCDHFADCVDSACAMAGLQERMAI